MKNNYHHNLKFEQTTFKSQKNKDTFWADCGLRDLLVDSGVYAGNTAEHMLVCKEFNRDVGGSHIPIF
jgi:hypothetical protein